jgi:hypothetical protein
MSAAMLVTADDVRRELQKIRNQAMEPRAVVRGGALVGFYGSGHRVYQGKLENGERLVTAFGIE